MSTDFELTGHAGTLFARRWDVEDPAYVVVIAHGYGEHIGRYEHVADRFVTDGAAVFAQDHVGHGRSDGERVLINDYEDVVADLHLLVGEAQEAYPGKPIVLIGHSMGGRIAARYAQLHDHELAALVLSGPALGPSRAPADQSSPAPPINPDLLSRDLSVGAAYAEDPLVWHGERKPQTAAASAKAADAIAGGGRISTPALWIHGSDDQMVPYDVTAQAWERLAGERRSAKVYDGARHEPFNETNKDEVLDDVVAFIRENIKP